MARILIMAVMALILSIGLAHSNEMGSGGGTSYPSTLDTDDTIETVDDYAREDVPNDSNAAIVAIENELGVSPKGSYGSVKLRLDGMPDLSLDNTFTGYNTFSQNTIFSNGITLGAASDLVLGGTGSNAGSSIYPFFAVWGESGYFNLLDAISTKYITISTSVVVDPELRATGADPQSSLDVYARDGVNYGMYLDNAGGAAAQTGLYITSNFLYGLDVGAADNRISGQLSIGAQLPQYDLDIVKYLSSSDAEMAMRNSYGTCLIENTGGDLRLTPANSHLVDINTSTVKINHIQYAFPDTQGSASDVLTNDGSGNLSWAAAAGGGSYWVSPATSPLDMGGYRIYNTTSVQSEELRGVDHSGTYYAKIWGGNPTYENTAARLGISNTATDIILSGVGAQYAGGIDDIIQSYAAASLAYTKIQNQSRGADGQYSLYVGAGTALNGITFRNGITDMINFRNTKITSALSLDMGGYAIYNSSSIQATYFYGDGSNLTNLPAGASYWISTATSPLNMANYAIYAASSVRVNNANGDTGLQVNLTGSGNAIAVYGNQTDGAGSGIGVKGYGAIGVVAQGAYQGIRIDGGQYGIYDAASTLGWYNNTKIDTPLLVVSTVNAAYTVNATTVNVLGIVISSNSSDAYPTRIYEEVGGDLSIRHYRSGTNGIMLALRTDYAQLSAADGGYGGVLNLDALDSFGVLDIGTQNADRIHIGGGVNAGLYQITIGSHSSILTNNQWLLGNWRISASSSITAGVVMLASGTVRASRYENADGSAFTGTGDNLGNHTATAELNMAGFGIASASTITINTGGDTSQYGLRIFNSGGNQRITAGLDSDGDSYLNGQTGLNGNGFQITAGGSSYINGGDFAINDVSPDGQLAVKSTKDAASYVLLVASQSAGAMLSVNGAGQTSILGSPYAGYSFTVNGNAAVGFNSTNNLSISNAAGTNIVNSIGDNGALGELSLRVNGIEYVEISTYQVRITTPMVVQSTLTAYQLWGYELDAITGASIEIGKTNATALYMGRAGAPTTITGSTVSIYATSFVAGFDATNSRIASTNFIIPVGNATTEATQCARQVISGSGLTGGGNFTADRTLVVGAGTGITVNADDVAVNQSYNFAFTSSISVAGLLQVSSSVIVASSITAAGQILSNSRKLIDQYDFAVCISSPYSFGSFGTSSATLISPFRSYACTISSITAHIKGGTSVAVQIEQRDVASPDTAGTNIWSSAISATTAGWIGGTIGDNTVPANSALYLQLGAVSGAVDRLEIRYTITKD